MSLRGIVDAILGRSKIETSENDAEYYKQLAAVKAIVDESTRALKNQHDELNEKLDAQSETLNKIFEGLGRTDGNGDA